MDGQSVELHQDLCKGAKIDVLATCNSIFFCYSQGLVWSVTDVPTRTIMTIVRLKHAHATSFKMHAHHTSDGRVSSVCMFMFSGS